jgi:hypothetical protein
MEVRGVEVTMHLLTLKGALLGLYSTKEKAEEAKLEFNAGYTSEYRQQEQLPHYRITEFVVDAKPKLGPPFNWK